MARDPPPFRDNVPKNHIFYGTPKAIIEIPSLVLDLHVTASSKGSNNCSWRAANSDGNDNAGCSKANFGDRAGPCSNCGSPNDSSNSSDNNNSSCSSHHNNSQTMGDP